MKTRRTAYPTCNGCTNNYNIYHRVDRWYQLLERYPSCALLTGPRTFILVFHHPNYAAYYDVDGRDEDNVIFYHKCIGMVCTRRQTALVSIPAVSIRPPVWTQDAKLLYNTIFYKLEYRKWASFSTKQKMLNSKILNSQSCTNYVVL